MNLKTRLSSLEIGDDIIYVCIKGAIDLVPGLHEIKTTLLPPNIKPREIEIRSFSRESGFRNLPKNNYFLEGEYTHDFNNEEIEEYSLRAASLRSKKDDLISKIEMLKAVRKSFRESLKSDVLLRAFTNGDMTFEKYKEYVYSIGREIHSLANEIQGAAEDAATLEEEMRTLEILIDNLLNKVSQERTTIGFYYPSDREETVEFYITYQVLRSDEQVNYDQDEFDEYINMYSEK